MPYPKGLGKNSPYISGISTPENLKKWASYATRNSYTGGDNNRAPTTMGPGKMYSGAEEGAISGEGRLKKRKYGFKASDRGRDNQ